MMITVTPDERLALIAKARAEYDRARSRLMFQVRRALDEADELPPERKRELGPSAIGRAAKFTREYISQIRDSSQLGDRRATPIAKPNSVASGMQMTAIRRVLRSPTQNARP